MVVSTAVLRVAVLVYLMVIFYLGWAGYKKTKDIDDYMIAGRKIHSYVLALSYGATFISTSAIVGFGGSAGVLRMGLLWLTFMNIFVILFMLTLLAAAMSTLSSQFHTMGYGNRARLLPRIPYERKIR